MAQEEAGLQLLKLEDMSGGLNSNVLSSIVKDNEATDCQNVIWYDGCLQKVFGTTRHLSQIGGSSSTTRITGMVDFQKRDSTQYFVVTTEDDILNFNTAPGTSIEGTLGVTDFLHQFAVFNDRLIGTNYNDSPWTWNGAGNAVLLSTLCGANLPPLNAKWICTFNSRLCFGNYIDNGGNTLPTSVAFSDIDTVISWDLTDNTWEFETDDAQEITGIRQLKDKLVVYKSDAIGIVTGYGLQSWTVNRDFIRGVGCVSGYTLKTGHLLQDGKLVEVHIFLSHEGLKAFDGTNIYHLPIAEKEYKVAEYWDGMNKALMMNACGEYYRKRNWYFCFYTASGASQNLKGSIYDYSTNSFWPLSGVNVTCTTTRYNSTTKETEVMLGTDDGRVLKLDETSDEFENTTELVTDGSMEAVGVANWASYNGGTRVKDVAVYLNGVQGLDVGSAGPGQGVEQDITTVVGKRYVLSCWVISTVGAAGAWQIDALNGSTSLGLDYVTHSAVAWTTGKVTFTATSTTTTIRIQDRRGAGGNMTVDDVSCRLADIDGWWTSKNYDFGSEQDMKILREFVPFAFETDNTVVSFYLYFDKVFGTSTTDTLDLDNDSAIWGEFVWGAVVWGGDEEIQDDLNNLEQAAFRTLRIKFRNVYGGQRFKFSKIYISVLPIGRRFYHEG